MAAIRSTNTRPEKLLAHLLKKEKIKYKNHYPICGKPDFVIVKKKLAIFVDGDFWHGHNWKLRGLKNLESELNKYNAFWRKKIQTNVDRDKKITAQLKKTGWKIIRIWESDLKRNPDKIINAIKKKIYSATRPAL